MGLFAKLGGLFGRGPKELTEEERRELEAVKAQMRDRCRHFRTLLSANKRALETMSEVEEHLAGARPYTMGYVRECGARTAAAVYRMVRELDSLTGGAWPALEGVFRGITARMDALSAGTPRAADGPLVLPLAELGLAHVAEVGGKMASLGEVASGAGLPVPAGFAVTVSAWRLFLRENGLEATIEKLFRATDMDAMDQVFDLSAKLRQAIQAAPLPQALEAAITGQVERLVAGEGGDVRLALRSSAVGEDALGASFAGQYRSELNVLPDEVCDTWKEIVASKYTVAALSYRYQRGIPDEEAPMSVGVVRMVRALAGGVAYSVDPVAPAGAGLSVVINAVPGLPAAVVDGGVTPDTFVLTHEHPAAIVRRDICVKTSRLDIDEGQSLGMRRTALDAAQGARPSITDDQARRVARMALALEEYYNKPQDVEWALEDDGKGGVRCVILQSRPLQLAGAAPDAGEGAAGPQAGEAAPAPQGEGAAAVDPSDVLASGGVAVSRGVAMGKVYVARRDVDMLHFEEGSILVVERAYPRWAPLLPRAAGMVSEHGGMAGHLASVAREYGVPAVFGLACAMKALEGAGVVTLDADHARILKGEHPQLRRSAPRQPRLMDGSPVQRRLEELAGLVIPLHLLDPEAASFVPENCTSLHDVTRFCHEQAARFIFGGDTEISRSMGKQLKAGARLKYWVIDMEDGFARDIAGPVVDIGEIRSRPMLALWDGMVAVPWAGPPAASAAGFMSVVFESTMNPELEVTAANSMSERNYFIISADYMLLQARYGYHFCTVEALAGAETQENFVSFQFKGGAADLARRKLRAAMIAGLLEEYGFRADVRGDSLFAVAENLPAEDCLMRARLVGYLLIHTRQCDMIMEDGASASAFREKLHSDMARVAQGPARR